MSLDSHWFEAYFLSPLHRKNVSFTALHNDLAKILFCTIKMVPEIGVEPTTFALRMRCSTN